MYVDDLAEACVFLMLNYNENEFVNIGTGEEVSIGSLAEIIKKTVGYGGKIVFDAEKPNGTPRKLMDITKLKNLGYQPTTELSAGINSVYTDFSGNYAHYTQAK